MGRFTRVLSEIVEVVSARSVWVGEKEGEGVEVRLSIGMGKVSS